MIIKSLELKNFRNYDDLDIDFSSGVNVLYGDNAQGKTNILEAIYMCATTKSHRSGKDRDIIEFMKEDAHIKVNLLKKDIPYRIDIHLKKNRPKGIAINGTSISKSSELFGILNTIIFSPEDLSLVKDGPAIRRRFIDMEMCQLSKSYIYALINYNKVIMQRNKLLRDMYDRKDMRDTLNIWDEQLVNYGSKIIKEREKFIENISEIISKIHENLTEHGEKINITYEKSVDIDRYREKLKENRDIDVRLKMTMIGPHRDDISIMIDGVDIRRFGSQGQQRTAALSLKLAEVEIVKKESNDMPVFLLDDVLSELDMKRREKLLEEIKDMQTIITCTDAEEIHMKNYKDIKTYHIEKGRAILDKEGEIRCNQ